LRLPNLGRPHAFSFDETYYAKDAFSLLEFGYERTFVDKANEMILASNGDPSTLQGVFGDGPEYVVHPPVGKWVIAIGEHAFGVTPFGWRIMVALLGILAVLITVRVGRRLTRSTLIGGIAGLLLTLDGQAIVHSRTALLDPVLMFWALLAFAAVLLDRDRTRGLLAAQVLRYPDDISATEAARAGAFGRFLGWRPWLWVAGLCLGLAGGTKWSGLYFLVGFGLLAVGWDVSTRRLVGVRRPYLTTLVRSAPVALLAMLALGLVVYVASWSGWLLTDGGYFRNWADSNPATGLAGFVPDALRSLWHYHAEAYDFHRTLTTPHSYQSNPWSWPLQSRPTSYFFESPTLGQQGCTVDKCASEVVALGNPIIWWAALLAVLQQTWRWVARRDWRSGAVVVAYAAGWVPWLFFQGRTIFTFYAVAYVPFVALSLAMSAGVVLGPPRGTTNRRAVGAAVVGVVLLSVVVAAYWFYPIWTAEVIPYVQWERRMWLPTWI
jgi:dolichyl-phosphate-mannose--protein O-mannosyl transferase